MALDLKARITMDGAGFQRGLQTAESGVAALSKRIGALFTVGAVANFAKRIIDWGSEINDVATRLGVSIERAQELRFAATQSGADISDVATGLTKLADAFETMQQGGAQGEKLRKAFETLGVTITDLATKKPDELLESIANNLATTGVNSEKTAAMLDLFGKSGGKLIPVLTELNAKTKEFRESGLGLTTEDIKSLDEAGDFIDKFWLKFKVEGAKALIGWKELFKAALSGGDHDLFAMDFAEFWEGRAELKAKELEFKMNQQARGKDKRRVPDYSLMITDKDRDDWRKSNQSRLAREQAIDRMAENMNRRAGDRVRGDELTAVGNFLGARGQLQSITDKHIVIQTDLLKRYLPYLYTIATRLGSGTTGVPL